MLSNHHPLNNPLAGPEKARFSTISSLSYLKTLFKMVAIKSSLSSCAAALMVNPAPSISKARTIGLGQSAVTLWFFPTPDSTYDSTGTPDVVPTVFVPQAGIPATSIYYPSDPYGSVSLYVL